MDLCQLLQVHHLKTSVYHPQTDGLVERFNQTLNSMLKKVVTDGGWDKLLPYILFAAREIPQASTGFTPFELLFGCRSRGLMDVAREEQPALFSSVVEYVRDMQEKINSVLPTVCEHLTRAQKRQQTHNKSTTAERSQGSSRWGACCSSWTPHVNSLPAGRDPSPSSSGRDL